MAFPTLVNVGAVLAQANIHNQAPNLPGSRVNNNVLLAHIGVAATGKSFTVAGGWAIIDSHNVNAVSGCWAWRIVDGTEVSPNFTWSGNANAQSVVIQWANNDPATPIGAFVKSTGIGTQVTSTALVSTNDNSVLQDILVTSIGGYAIGGLGDRVVDRVSIYNNGTTIATLADYGQINLSGTTTDTATYALQNSSFIMFSIEIRGTGLGAPDQILETQEAAPAVLTYSVPILEGRASQTNQNALMTYVPPSLAAIVTQITVSSIIPIAPPVQKVQVQIYD